MIRVLFMQPETRGLFSWWTKPGSPGTEVLLVIGMALVLAVVFFIWAAYVRRPRRKHHSHRHHHHHSSDDEQHRKSSGVASLFGAKRRRRRTHRRERQVNPTLAQVGGLPPRRDEQRPPN
jgi:hypothetical protein